MTLADIRNAIIGPGLLVERIGTNLGAGPWRYALGAIRVVERAVRTALHTLQVGIKSLEHQRFVTHLKIPHSMSQPGSCSV